MTCDEGNNKFGLLVSALGEIPTISKNQVEPLNIIFGNETTYVATGIAKIQTSDGKGKMLTVLSTDKMHARTNLSTNALLVTI
jgi:chemotaxis signal transduction protein